MTRHATAARVLPASLSTPDDEQEATTYASHAAESVSDDGLPAELISKLENLLDLDDASIKVTWPAGYDALRARRALDAAKISAACLAAAAAAAASASTATAFVPAGTSMQLPSSRFEPGSHCV